jgi:putative FmdB family regulatory protein
MPFYEYECSNCKFYSEVMQKISDAPLTKCPSCGKKTLVKLVSAPNFRLKGGGWYETDFKGDKENKRNLAGADRDESSKSETPAAGSKDSTSKTETAKPESAKAETATTDAASKTASTSGSSSDSGSKESSGRRSPSSSRPVSRAPAGKAKVAASKSRPALARSKAKPPAKKKARR